MRSHAAYPKRTARQWPDSSSHIILGQFSKATAGTAWPLSQSGEFITINIPAADNNTSDADVRFLNDQLNSYNVKTIRIRDGRIVSFFICDHSAQVIVGLYGWTWGGMCEVRYLWIREEYVNAAMARPC